jgi:hypothetical protein
MHEEATASQAVADLVARHHESSYSEHEYFTASTAPAEAEPVAEAPPEHEPYDASDNAPDYTPAYAAEHSTESALDYATEHVPDYTENYAEPVAHVEPEAEVAHSNGRSTAWEPLSLVTHVDEDTAPLEHDSFRDPSMPEGVSIWLSHGSSGGVYDPEMEEKGSVSFSLSPDDGPDTHPIASDASPDVPREHVEPAAAPAAATPSYQSPSQDVAGVYSAAKEPTNGHIDNLPAAQPSAGTTTADIVGSLISRALTFRIK